MTLKSRLLLGIVLVCCLLITARIASAHAELIESDPPANAILDAAPTTLRLVFSEPPEVRLSSVQLLDPSGKAIPGLGTLQIDPANAKQLTLGLPTLPHGIYTVSWATVSQADGHDTSGTFSFAIGQEFAASFKPQSSLPDIAAPSLIAVLIKWISYLSLALVVGGFAFLALVYRPMLKEAALPDRYKQVLIGAWLVTLIAAIVSIPVYFSTAAITDLPGLLVSTRYGVILVARLVILASLGLLITQNPIEIHAWGGSIFVGVLALLTFSLGSHAAADDSAFWSIGADWLHLIATNVWIGGLVALVLALIALHRDQNAKGIARVVNRFSDVAAICVLILAITGIYRAVIEIQAPGNLLDTTYGQTLLLKLGFFAVLLALAAINLIVIKPRLVKSAAKSTLSLYGLILRTVGLEITFVTIVLLVTGYLSSLEPSRGAFGSDRQLYQATSDFRTILALAPGKPGYNNFDLYLRSGLGGAPPDIAEIRLSFSMVERDLGEKTVTASDLGDGHYSVSGAYVPVPGTWHLRVMVRRTGQDDTQVAYTIPMTADGIPPAPGPVLSIQTWVGLEIAFDGLLLAYGSRRLGGLDRWAGRGALAVAFLALVFGFNMSFTAFINDNSGSFQDVVAADADSVAKGKIIYANNCALCHGPAGLGDGPSAAGLNPPPANLQNHVNAHSSEVLFNWVTNGISGTAMPAFQDSLDERQRWDVINYIRTLAH
jgi:copper transport protein